MQTVTIAEFIEELKADGVILYVSDGKLRTRGPQEAVARWKQSMVVRKDELLAYLIAQETSYVDPITRYDEEEHEEVPAKKQGTWDAEDAWSYYLHLYDILQAKKRKMTRDIPMPSLEICYLGRLINLAAITKHTVHFRAAVDKWFDAYMDMIDQAEQGIWKGDVDWNKRSEAVKVYARTSQLILYAWESMPESDRPSREHPDVLKIEREIAQGFCNRDFEAIRDACFKLSKKWRELGLAVVFK